MCKVICLLCVMLLIDYIVYIIFVGVCGDMVLCIINYCVFNGIKI